MAQVSTIHAEPSVETEALRAGGAAPRRGTILVVEDRDDVRQGLSQLLELHGYLVCDAADAEQALSHLAADPEGFALILLDLLLPGALSGRDLRARQLGDDRLASIPTIVVSACEPDLRGRAQLRPDAWLEKPFRFETLLAIVRQFVTPEGGSTLADSDL